MQTSSLPRAIRPVIAGLTAFLVTACASAGTGMQHGGAVGTGAFDATARYMESIRNDPNALMLFLTDMPKGGDLHNHLSGSVYAESFVKWAVEDRMCLTRATLSISAPPCDESKGKIPAAEIPRDARLFGDVIDAWSMRNWNPARQNGHDQFFESFSKFDAPHSRLGDMLAEVAARAAAQHLTYMELMFGPERGRAIRLGLKTGVDTVNFGRTRDRLLAAGLRDSLSVARKEIDAAEVRERSLLGCTQKIQPNGCAITIRYLYQVLRGLPPEAVFSQILAGFEMARMDSRFVGFNLVMPEDDPVPMRDFRLHMRMIDFLHPLYPDVKITLHAGELAEGLVPPEGLKFHIRESIEQGHASRIGHGTAVIHEADPVLLLREMAAKKILVEVALSSSDAILGIRGKAHPITTYLRYGVPVALATDDEGVARSTITREYRKAIEEQGLDYRAIKAMARNSIAYSFVEDGTKSRLLAELDQAFTRFEGRHAATNSR